MRKISTISLIIMLCFISSCTKEIVEPIKLNENTINKASNTSGTSTARVDTYLLDWDNGGLHNDYMPTPSGIQIPAPWASTASRQISSDIIDDYHKINGWELLYNTFNTFTLSDHLYFILYNKYRGIIRIYYYVKPSSNLISSANIIHTISTEGTYGTQSPILNFADQEFVDFNIISKFASTLEPQQVAPGTWYASQYELAYDKNTSLQNYQTYKFNWPIRSSQISAISLSGTLSGTITSMTAGTVQYTGKNFLSDAGSGTIELLNKKVRLKIKGQSDADKFGVQIKNLVQDVVTNGANGIIKNVLGGIFGLTSGPSVTNMDINATINLTGSLTSNFLIASPGFAMPGYNQDQTSGPAPSYNKPLGVFYLSAKPLIRDYKSRKPGQGGFGNNLVKIHDFIIDNNSFNIIFNPAITGGSGYTAIASIANIKKEVIFWAPSTHVFAIDGTKETLANTNTIFRSGVTTAETNNAYVPNLYLRISFDVVPLDGSAKVRISKTFAVTTQTIIE